MKIKILLPVLCLAACAPTAQDYNAYLAKHGITETDTSETLSHCRGYGCRFIDEVTLNPQEWAQIEKHFHPAARNALEERTKIANAIGTFETIIGAKTGSNVDIKGTFKKTGNYQLDCVDESTNTTTYLAALQNRGFLKFHTLEAPTARWPLIHSGRWPHQTAVIREKETGAYYAADSWFHDNGAPAEIISLKTWKDGWRPKEG